MDDLRIRAIAAYREKSKAQYEQHLKNQESQCQLLEREFVSCFGNEPDEVNCEHMIIKSSGLRFMKSDTNTWCVVDTCVSCKKYGLIEIVDLVGLGEWFDIPSGYKCVDCQIKKQVEPEPKPLWKRVLGWE